MDFMSYNETDQDLYIQGGAGVTIGGPATVYIAPGY